MNNELMISIKNLSKMYESGTQAIDKLSMEVYRGEIYALLGPNGAGKSSTIRILTTLSGFDEGQVEVAGHNVDIAANKVRSAIGYVAQDTGVDFFLSGRENLVLQGHLYKMRKADIETRISELAKYFGLEDVLDDLVSSYSGGMRRKLDIATALIHKPQLIFLDEPTLGLDTQSRRNLWDYIRKLNSELGLTILLTTHYLDEADKLASRVAIIDKGQIKVHGKPETLKDQIQGDVVSLQFEDPKDKNALETKLTANSFVKEHKWEQNKLHLYVTNGASCIPQLIEECNALNTHVKNVSFARPSLDDVFIKITGASIEAQADEGENKWWEKWAGKGGGGAWAKKWQEANKKSENSDDNQEWQAEAGQWSEEEQKQWWSQQQAKENSTEASNEPHEDKSAQEENSDWAAAKSQWTEEEQQQWWQQNKTANTSEGNTEAEHKADDTTSEDQTNNNETADKQDWQKEAGKWSEEERKAWWSEQMPSNNATPDEKAQPRKNSKD